MLIDDGSCYFQYAIAFFMKLFLLAIFLFSSARLTAQPVANPVVTYKIIAAAHNTFGYDIFSGDHRLIHQASKPCLPGNEGFRRRKDAAKVAQLVVKKLDRHLIPPTVSLHEMDSLKIHY